MGYAKIKIILLAALILAGALAVYALMKENGNSALRAIRIGRHEVEVEIVDTPALQHQGLSGRPSLDPNQGMLFVYNDKAIRHFWMPNMNFALDVLWIAGGKVVGWQEDIQPLTNREITRFQSPVPVDMVLEVNTGWIKKNGIELEAEVIW